MLSSLWVIMLLDISMRGLLRFASINQSLLWKTSMSSYVEWNRILI